uniref:transposase n=1 Tax=Vibrio vulnificus TaxID=672 RepID=UPI0019D42EB4|nr:transposase [Vibrio vulnificus]
VLVTDQCRSIRKAVKQVMPQVRHRWCIWHIVRKIPEKLVRKREYDSLKKELKDIVFYSFYVEDFERRWSTMVRRYSLERNKWLRE